MNTHFSADDDDVAAVPGVQPSGQFSLSAEDDDWEVLAGTRPSGQFSLSAEDDDWGMLPGIQPSGSFAISTPPGQSQPMWVYTDDNESSISAGEEAANLRGGFLFPSNQGSAARNQPGASTTRTRRRFPRRIIQACVVLVILIGGLILAVGRVQSALGSQAQGNTSTSAPGQPSPVISKQASTSTPKTTGTPISKRTSTPTPKTTSTPAQSSASIIPSGWSEVLNDPLTASNHDSLWVVDGNACAFQANGYEEQSTGSNYCARGSSNISSSIFSDQYYRLDLSIQQGSQGGLIFRNQDDNYYYLSITTTGNYSLSAHASANGGEDTQIVSGSSSVIHQGQGQWNRLAVLARGNSFVLYINGVRVNTATDTTYRQGIIGVAVNGPGPQDVFGDALFKNVTVWVP